MFREVTFLDRAFSASQEITEDIEIVLGLRKARSKPLPPKFKNFSKPFLITEAEMLGA